MQPSKKSRSLIVSIPAGTAPQETGYIVAGKIKKVYGGSVSPLAYGTSSAAVSLSAIQGDKERMRLDEVELQFGADWLPVKLGFKWKKK